MYITSVRRKHLIDYIKHQQKMSCQIGISVIKIPQRLFSPFEYKVAESKIKKEEDRYPWLFSNEYVEHFEEWTDKFDTGKFFIPDHLTTDKKYWL